MLESQVTLCTVWVRVRNETNCIVFFLLFLLSVLFLDYFRLVLHGIIELIQKAARKEWPAERAAEKTTKRKHTNWCISIRIPFHFWPEEKEHCNKKP
jgi:hypothetical protein